MDKSKWYIIMLIGIKTNKVEWVDKLTDCKIKYIDIVEDPTVQKKQEIVVVSYNCYLSRWRRSKKIPS